MRTDRHTSFHALQAAFQALPIAVFFIDARGRLTAANTTARRLNVDARAAFTNGHGRGRAAQRVRLWRLTPREAAVLHHLVRGDSNKEIAADLHCEPTTVETHATRIFRKAGVANRVQLTAKFWDRTHRVGGFPDGH